MYAFVTFLTGLLFGLGLAISEMTNPAVVIGFLNIFGDWNPSLIAVMGGAIFVGMLGYWIKNKRLSPIIANEWQVPNLKHIDRKLLIGAGLFGIGWGLSGYCPGPGLTALTNNPLEGIYFVGALIVGSAIHHFQNVLFRK